MTCWTLHQAHILRAEVTPFLSLNGGGSGARAFADARAYRGLGDGDRFVLAGPSFRQAPSIPTTYRTFRRNTCSFRAAGTRSVVNHINLWAFPKA